jgi:hypothetical protein
MGLSPSKLAFVIRFILTICDPVPTQTLYKYEQKRTEFGYMLWYRIMDM